MDESTQISAPEMLAVRDGVKARLVIQYHSHVLVGRLYRRFQNIPRALVEEADAVLLKTMIEALAAEDEPPKGTSIRLGKD